MAEVYQNIRVILDKIMRHPLLSPLTLETVIDYTVDFMRIVGVPKMFIDKIVVIPIVDYQGDLPSDWIATNMVKFNERPMRSSTDMFYLDHVKIYSGTSVIPQRISNNPMGNPNYDLIGVLNTYLQLHTLDDVAELKYGETDDIRIIIKDIVMDSNYTERREHSNHDNTFMIQGSYINTSMEKGVIVMSYRAIATDTDGYPLIPDNSDFTRALETYIKVQYFTILFDLGKIQPGVLNQAKVDYAWAVGDCESEFKRMDLSRAESFFNSMKTLVLRNHQFREGFKRNGGIE